MQEATKERGVNAINPLLSPGDQHWLEPHKHQFFLVVRKREMQCLIPPGQEVKSVRLWVERD